jgi:two-component system sensor histidine kinase DesK
MSWLFAGVWLVYLLPVLQDALARPSLVARVVGMLGLAGFGVQYATAFAALSRLRRAGRTPGTAWGIRVLGGASVLFVVTALAVGQSALSMFVFIAVQGVFVLSRRNGLILAAALIALEEILTRVVRGWSPVEGLWISIALAALAVWGVTGMIERNVELARAQATIAEMAVQAERARFARDLHDILGHSLTVLTVKAELAGRLVSIDPAAAEREIAEMRAAAEREIVHQLGEAQAEREAATDARRAADGELA